MAFYRRCFFSAEIVVLNTFLSVMSTFLSAPITSTSSYRSTTSSDAVSRSLFNLSISEVSIFLLGLSHYVFAHISSSEPTCYITSGIVCICGAWSRKIPGLDFWESRDWDFVKIPGFRCGLVISAVYSAVLPPSLVVFSICAAFAATVESDMNAINVTKNI